MCTDPNRIALCQNLDERWVTGYRTQSLGNRICEQLGKRNNGDLKEENKVVDG